MLPLLKRKKAAATCTLSLTNVSVHRSIIPFPASNTDIPSLASTSAIHAPSPSPPRQRTNASLLCRKRCARQVEPEYPQSTTPRKRARKASLSSLYPRKSTLLPHKQHTLAAAMGFGPGSLALTGDLKFLCNVYRSIASTKLKREFAKAEKRLFDSSMRMDVDMDIDSDIKREELDEQETIFMDRLRSYLIFHEINPQWLDVTPHSTTSWVDDMQIVNDPQGSSSALAPPSTTPPLLPINPQPQIIASLLFRHRHRVKLTNSSAKSRLLAKVACAKQYGGWKRRTIPRSPLVDLYGK